MTGFPEMLDGRVKTLHPAVHGALLARRDIARSTWPRSQEQGIVPIDLVAVNLYPFQRRSSRPGVSFDDAVENIDIGGPSMLRSAAKNHESVLPVVDPTDYPRVLELLARRRLTPDAAARVRGQGVRPHRATTTRRSPATSRRTRKVCRDGSASPWSARRRFATARIPASAPRST